MNNWITLWEGKGTFIDSYTIHKNRPKQITKTSSCCCSVAWLCLTLCDPMDCSTPGFPVLHHLPKLTQTHVHWVGMPSNHLVIPFSNCPQSFPALGSFPVSPFFASGGLSIGASASASILPKNIQGWYPLGLAGLISLLSKGLKSLLQHHSLKASVLQCSAFFVVQLSHPHMTTGKPIALTIWTFVSKVISLFFNMLSSRIQKKSLCDFGVHRDLLVCKEVQIKKMKNE